MRFSEVAFALQCGKVLFACESLLPDLFYSHIFPLIHTAASICTWLSMMNDHAHARHTMGRDDDNVEYHGTASFSWFSVVSSTAVVFISVFWEPEQYPRSIHNQWLFCYFDIRLS